MISLSRKRHIEQEYRKKKRKTRLDKLESRKKIINYLVRNLKKKDTLNS